jgi:WhiB family redox-sensing transcriptional regulator
MFNWGAAKRRFSRKSERVFRGRGNSPSAWGLRRHVRRAQEGGTLMDGQGIVADLLGNAPEWQERALCSQTDPEAFFPEKGGSTREAKRICSRCEVKADCLEFALGKDERFGIWGGLSERERRKLKRRAA